MPPLHDCNRNEQNISATKWARRILVTNGMYRFVRARRRTGTMADRTGLRIIGFIAASITAAVMLIAVVLVHKTVASEASLDDSGFTASIR